MCKEYRNLKETESDVEKAKERQDWNMSILEKELRENSYPGRGIVIGRSAAATAVTASSLQRVKASVPKHLILPKWKTPA